VVRRFVISCSIAVAVSGSVGVAVAATPGPDVRLTNDASAYVSGYTLATGTPYSDATLDECSHSRGRQNEPSVAIDPRNHSVLVGSSNDYCGVYNAGDDPPSAIGPIWLGYYRSEDGGASFTSSLVPGYPGDTSPYAALAAIRTASSGDPVLAWDKHGRLFAGSESSADPAGSKKGFGDVWVGTYGPSSPNTLDDGKAFLRSVIVERGSSSAGAGTFNDKTAIEVDRTTTACEGNVYFAWSRFSGSTGAVTIYLSRSTDHGQTFSKKVAVSGSARDVQFPDIAVTSDGAVHVLYRRFDFNKNQDNAVFDAVSRDCGKTFAKPRLVTGFVESDAQDVADPVAPAKPLSGRDDPFGADSAEAGGEAGARDCGDLDAHCVSGYTFFRRDTQVRATADQDAPGHDVYLVYDATVPGSEVPTGTTYGTVGSGTGGQAAIYFARIDGDSGAVTGPARIAAADAGHQVFPDIAASNGTLHALWWDSRNDPTYSPALPIGNDAAGNVHPSLDVYASSSDDRGADWAAPVKLTDTMSNPNYEQFSNRTVPFAGDYLWIDAQGEDVFGVWTDWRDTAPGTDIRVPEPDPAGENVLQCRTVNSAGTIGRDTCPRAGGLDQNVYGDKAP
jgi:hypothetical protein